MRQQCPNCFALVPLPDPAHGPAECPKCLTRFVPVDLSSDAPEPTERRLRNPLVAILGVGVLTAASVGVWVAVSRSGPRLAEPKPPEPQHERAVVMPPPGPPRFGPPTPGPDEEAAAQAVARVGATLTRGPGGAVEEVRLTRSSQADAALAGCIPFKHLRVIELAGTDVSDAGLKALGGFPELHTIDLAECKNITSGGLAHLAPVKTLRALKLTDTWVGDTGLAHLAKMPRLSDVYLGHTATTDAGLASLATCPELHRLQLAHTGVTDAGLKVLTDAPKLWYLELAGTRVTDAALAYIPECVLGLDLTGTGVTDGGMKMLGRFPKLISLYLSHTAVGDPGVRALPPLLALQRLYLNGTKVSDAVIPDLARHPLLSTLSLQNTGVTDECVPVLLAIKSLQSVDLDLTRVTPKGKRRLRDERGMILVGS